MKNMLMTELESELAKLFEQIGLNFRQRRYYDEIFLSGYACKLIDDLHEYKDEDIERIARIIAENGTGVNIAMGIEYKIIYIIVKSALIYSNCQSQDEHDYENEIQDNSVGGFGICIPLAERVFFKNGYVIYYAFFPDFQAEEFKTKEKFDSMRPIKEKMDEIIEKGIYKESIVIKYDDAIRNILENDENYMARIPERSSMLPEIMIHKNPKSDFYEVELNQDFRQLMEQFDAIDAWELDENQFRQVFPMWCNPVKREKIENIYKTFSEFVLKNNNCKNTKKMAQAICTLIHS